MDLVGSDAVSSFADALRVFQDKLPERDKSEARVFAPKVAIDSTVEEKRELFNKAINDLAILENDLNDDEIAEFSSFFVSVYQDDGCKFRHMYSDVCSVMFGFLTEDGKLDDGVPFPANKLANNIFMILEKIKKTNPDERAVRCVMKLYDHIELENKRMRYMTVQNKAQQKSARRLKKRFEANLRSEVDQASANFEASMKEKIEDTQQKLQRNYISILGIFAAVVVAFMSGSAFSSSVLENIDKASIYRISFIVLLIGFFLFNLVCALFIFLNRVSKIDNKPMLWLVAAVDVVIITAIVAVVVLRAFGVVSMFSTSAII